MEQWLRTAPFDSNSNRRIETWIYRDAQGGETTFPVDVTLGKPIDILALKQTIRQEYSQRIEHARKTRLPLFADTDKLERVDLCPICRSPDSEPVLTIYGANYHHCKNCSHHFVAARPTKEALEKFYTRDAMYQSTYADKATAQTRVEQVAIPKARWMMDIFEKQYGRAPKSVLDVGAGSGHFVQACRTLGIKSDGMEISESGRGFCKQLFGFELAGGDFIEQWKNFSGYEVITFWGVIEHVPYPLMMLDAASNALATSKQTMVVAEVPRWNCLGTSVQTVYNDAVIRHLEPLGHTSCFSDSSLATSFRKTGFDIAGAWYFGMDAYELVTQLAYHLDDDRVVDQLKGAIGQFQQRLDSALLSDEMIFAGVPHTA